MDALDNLLTPLKPTLLTLTNNLPTPLHNLALSLLGPHCTTTLLSNLDLSTANSTCLRLALSKALGIAIISAATVVKIPQLLKLIRSQSAAGLSFPSYLLETASYVITLAYSVRNGFPFSTYGETAFIAIQDVAIAACILIYSGRGALASAFVAAVAAGGYALLGPSEIVTRDTLSYLQAGAGFLGIAAKVPQIWTVWRQGSTGQLSAFAVFNYLFGSLSRIFTTLQEVDDPLILYGFITGFLLNAVLAAQMLYYWNNPATAPAQKAGLKHIKEKAGGNQGRQAALEHIKEKATGDAPKATGERKDASEQTKEKASGAAPAVSGGRKEALEHIKNKATGSAPASAASSQAPPKVLEGKWDGSIPAAAAIKGPSTRRRG